MEIQTIRQYTDAYYPNKEFDPLQVAIEIALHPNPSINLFLRAAMMRLIDEHVRPRYMVTVPFWDVVKLEDIVHELSGDWMQAVNRRRKSNRVNVDLAVWIVGQKIGEVSEQYVQGTKIPTALLPWMMFSTVALGFTLAVAGQDVIVSKAVRLNPKATYVPS